MRPTEKIIQRQIINMLQFYEACGKIGHFDRLNSGKAFIPAGRFSKGRIIRGTRKGTADIIVFIPIKNLNYSKILWLEVKREDAKQNESQVEFQKKVCEIPQHYYYVVRSADEAERILTRLILED